MTSISDPKVQEILSGRRIATLATLNADGSIHLTAVWYVVEDGSVYVGTSAQSRKGRNAAARPQASLMVDVREPGRERGVTVAGPVEIVSGERAQKINRTIRARYLNPAAVDDPRLGGVLASVDDIALRIRPASVFAWDMRELDAAMFGGEFGKPGVVLPVEP